MNTYRVEWVIDVDAGSAEEAAARALITMRDNDPLNNALFFTVQKHLPMGKRGHAIEVDLGRKC